jgi:hypothetical protein
MKKKSITGRKGKKIKSDREELLIGEVVDVVELETVRLIECQCNQQPGAEKAVHLERSEQFHATFTKGKKFLLVFPTLRLKGFLEENHPDDADASFSIVATFIIAYRMKSTEGIEDEHIQAFAKRNGLFNVWPYWREFVQSTMARFGLSQISLPLFKL